MSNVIWVANIQDNAKKLVEPPNTYQTNIQIAQPRMSICALEITNILNANLKERINKMLQLIYCASASKKMKWRIPSNR